LLILAFKPIPDRTACSTQNLLITGNIPGIAASTRLTWLLGPEPKSVDEEEKSFELDFTCA
jgi:hypothetical protein